MAYARLRETMPAKVTFHNHGRTRISSDGGLMDARKRHTRAEWAWFLIAIGAAVFGLLMLISGIRASAQDATPQPAGLGIRCPSGQAYVDSEVEIREREGIPSQCKGLGGQVLRFNFTCTGNDGVVGTGWAYARTDGNYTGYFRLILHVDDCSMGVPAATQRFVCPSEGGGMAFIYVPVYTQKTNYSFGCSEPKG
jgi:hypothetical protein